VGQWGCWGCGGVVGLEMWGCGALGSGMCDWLWGWMCDWLWGWAGLGPGPAGVVEGCGSRGAEELGLCVVRGWDMGLCVRRCVWR